MSEGEVIPAARQEGRSAEVLLPLVGHASRVVQFHVWVGVEEFEHPILHPARRPCPGSRAPDLPGQVGHELDLVLGNQAVLAVVAPEPLICETFVQVDRTYPVADVEILVDGEENLADHIEQDRLRRELAQVVY